MKRVFAILGALVLGVLGTAQAATCLVAAPGAPLTATITFVPPTINVDGTPVALPLTYNLYGSTVAGAEVKGLTGLKGSPIVVNGSIQPNTTYYVKLSVTDANGKESALSNEVCKSFGASIPGTVTITIS